MTQQQREELRQTAERARRSGQFRVVNEAAESAEQKLDRLARQNRDRVQRYRQRHGGRSSV